MSSLQLRIPASVGDLVRRRRGWVSKGLWAVTDQGLFALSNFALNLLLARWLPQRDYGAFAVAFSVLLLMGTVHTALLSEPMLVFGPSRYRDSTAAYVRRLTPLHFVVTAGMSAALLLGLLVLTFVRPSSGWGPALAGLAVSAPAILFLWLMRRACYIEARPHLAAAAGLAYALLIPAGMLLLTHAGLLTGASAFINLAVASLLVAWWLKLRLGRSRAAPGTTFPSANVATAHWGYGRWALGSGLLGWVPGNLVVLALPLWHSLSDAATLRVATMLIMPVLQIEAALGTLLTPALVRARLSGELRSTASMALILFSGFSFVYGPLVIGLGSRLAHWLFGGQYQFGGVTLWLLAATPLFTAISLVSSAVLRALERPDRVLWTNVASTAVTCVIGLPLIWLWSVDGALGSVLLSAVTAAVLATWAGHRLTEVRASAAVAPSL